MKKDKTKRTVTEGYSEDFKHMVIKEYLATGASKMILQRKYDIKFKSAICTWMKRLGYEDIHAKKPYFEMLNTFTLKERLAVAKQKKEPSELEQRIKELERELEDEKLRSEAYKLTIEIAEKELKIPIRKKSGTK